MSRKPKHIDPARSAISGTIIKSFHNWGKKDKKYKRTYKKTPAEALTIVEDAIRELKELKPGVFDFWWAMNHMRYNKKVKQDHVRYAHELAYHFLTGYAHGRLTTDTKKTSRQTTSGTGTDSVHRVQDSDIQERQVAASS